MIKLYELYYHFFNIQKKLNQKLLIAIWIHDGYFLLDTLMNELPIDIDLIGMPWIYFGLWKLTLYLFHRLIGKFWILKYQTWQTKEFQKHVMDKNIKAAGKRGGFKDTSQSGIASNFCKCCIEKIEAEIEEISVHLYLFDLKKVKEYVESHLEIFNVASKKKKRKNFNNAIVSNGLFLKKKYAKLDGELLDDYKKTRGKTATSDSKYIISNSVNHNHVVKLLYDYMYYIWRLKIDIWVISNQPYFQYYDFKTKKFKMAKVYSPDLKATKQRIVKVLYGKKQVKYISIDYLLAEDYILFWESEADIWWNNIDGNIKQNIVERGLRWGEVGIRHIMGENVMSLRNGQVAGRTAKIQRDLEESFYSVTRCVKVYGGDKMIFFIDFVLFLFKSVFRIKPNWKSYLIKKRAQLKMSGWLKLETVFSRSEQINYQAPAVSLSMLLDRDNPLYMSSYQTTLVFNIRDCWGKYNTHYLNFLAEELTKNSNAALMDLDEWTEDLELHKEQIISMNYDTVDMFNLSPEERYVNNKKYKKLEDEENENAMRLD